MSKDRDRSIFAPSDLIDHSAVILTQILENTPQTCLVWSVYLQNEGDKF